MFSMQYKFNVDGEWRHDELQPFVSGSYGVVNTLFLAREADMVPGGRSNMDVDDTTFNRMVRIFEELFSQLNVKILPNW